MDLFQVLHLKDQDAFRGFSATFERFRPDLHFALLHVASDDAVLRSDFGGMRVHWIYEGQGEVFLAKGIRTKEGDGHSLPPEYAPNPIDPEFAETLAFLDAHMDEVIPAAQAALRAILDRRGDGDYVGDCANDLWKFEHTPRPWSTNERVVEAIQGLFLLYREHGYSEKTVNSYEQIRAGDQLITAGREKLKVRGRFSCLTLEKRDRSTSHVPAAMRLRYLRDSPGGCNLDFDPFRRLPLTWYVNLPGESGDGLNFVNSHVVNIARETSPTHFHPRNAIGGGLPQNEIYLVLDPSIYSLQTYGRKPYIVLFPDLRDLSRYKEHPLEPGSFVFIPAGMGHRGIDVFVNVITIPGFKPHNEYYIDQEILDTTRGKSPYNEALLNLKNYTRLSDLL